MGNDHPFSPQTTLEQVDGDRDLLKELIEIFSNQTKQQLQILRDSIASSDTPTVRRAAHTIKGSVANFGAQPAFDLALCLEQMGRDGVMAEAPAALATLEAELIRLESALREFAAENGTGGGGR